MFDRFSFILEVHLLTFFKVIEFYTVETRAGCHPFDGEKQQIYTFKNHIVLVGKTGIQNLNMLEIFDHKNKHIAFSLSFGAITQIVSEWDKLYVFTREGKVYELEEKDVQKKIENLKEKKLFAEAIDLGEKELESDRESLARLYHLYGDELYRFSFITSSHHHINTSSHHHIITPSHHHIITSSYHHIITSSYHHIITSPFLSFSFSDLCPSLRAGRTTMMQQRINTFKPSDILNHRT